MLDPEQLDERTARAAAALVAEGESAITRASYAAALRYWHAWYAVRYGGRELAVPVPVPVVIQFIVDHAQHRDADHELPPGLPEAADQWLCAAGVKGKPGPMALNTLKHRLAVLARWHRSCELDSPLDGTAVRKLLAAVRTAYSKRNVRVRKKDALDAGLLRRLVGTCDGSPLGVRDRAMLYFAFSTGGRRRSEVAAARIEQLRRVEDGFEFDLGHSKTNQTGEQRPENAKPVMGEAARAMSDWLGVLDRAGITSGPLFRRILPGDRAGERLSGEAVRQMVQRRCALAGLQGDFSAHSLRAGFLTEAGKRKIPIAEAMAMSSHSSLQTAVGYMRAGELRRSRAATMVDEDPVSND